MKIAVVIVNYNSVQATFNLAKKLDTYKNINFTYVVNNSPRGDIQRSRKFRSDKLVLLENSGNLGFAGGVNVGLKRAMEKDVDIFLLINPDVAISQKDLKHLLESEFDITSPILHFARLGKDVYDYGGRVIWPIGRPVHREYSSLQKGVPPIDYVSGACMLIKREVVEKIGFFDERFFMYFEDVDYCLRAKRAGFTVGVNANVVVNHQIIEHRFSKDPDKTRYLLDSNRKFIDKWVPWYFLPAAYFYWFLLLIKSS